MTEIATIGADIPLDLLNATGRFAGPLNWHIDRPTPRADAWLESKFTPWARSIVEDWAEGHFDGLGEVIFSRSDDTSQRLYYYICELRARGLLGGPGASHFRRRAAPAGEQSRSLDCAGPEARGSLRP